MNENDFIVDRSEAVLITGSNGFIGSRVVAILIEYGFRDLVCLVRPSGNMSSLQQVIDSHPDVKFEIIRGNLLSEEDCDAMTSRARVIFHLAAGRGEKSYANAYLNSVVTTKNLLKAAIKQGKLKRFVNVSSFAVYSNWKMRRGSLLNESCDIEKDSEARGEAYCFAKVRQEQIVAECCHGDSIPYVTLRPGVVYGPGNKGIHGRIGIGTFGIFLHLGGSNRIPLTYVDNCAEAIVRAGIVMGVDGETFNVVDDDLPTSREFLRLYKKKVRNFRSFYVPYRVFYLFCYFWEKYSRWSEGQLPLAFNRKMCSNYWKGNRYSNRKMKDMLQWKQRVDFKEAALKYCEYQKFKGVQK